MNYQQRVIKEKQELDSNIDKLHDFIKSSDTFKGLPDHEKDLLLQQRLAMRGYSAVLGQRINGFGDVEAVEETPPNTVFDTASGFAALSQETEDVASPLFRAKLKVLQVIPDEEYETVVMASAEDPAAELTMAITNPDLHGKIQPGQQFCVDFTEDGVVELDEETLEEL